MRVHKKVRWSIIPHWKSADSGHERWHWIGYSIYAFGWNLILVRRPLDGEET